MPTETVYGLAARFDDPAAVARVFEAKERPAFDPLIVHIAEPDDLVRAQVVGVPEVSPALRALLARAWPGPLTVVLPRHPAVDDLVTAGLPTVAVRCPEHPVARELIRRAGPLVAPSANRFGRISPTRASHVEAELDGRVELVVDGGPCRVGVESTIIGFDDEGRPVLHRPGGYPPEAVAAALGPLGRPQEGKVVAPGQTPSHYAPGTRVLPVQWSALPRGLPARVALLQVAGPLEAAATAVEVEGLEVVRALGLSESGDPVEVARGLFAAMRELDGAGADAILVEIPSWSAGLGHAVVDRLRRAAAPRES